MKFTLTITDMTLEQVDNITTLVRSDDVARSENKPMFDEPQIITKTEVDLDDNEDDGGLTISSGAIATTGSYHTIDTESDAASDDLDSNGLPWDERIHAGSKKQNKDGSWKARKGVGDETKKVVEAELRGQVKQESLPTQAQATQSAPTERPAEFAPPVQQPVPPVQQPVPPVQQPVAPVQQPVAPVQQPKGVNIPDTGGIQDLMLTFQNLLMHKKLEPNFSIELVQHLNATYARQMSSIVEIGNDQELINGAFAFIKQKVGQ